MLFHVLVWYPQANIWKERQFCTLRKIQISDSSKNNNTDDSAKADITQEVCGTHKTWKEGRHKSTLLTVQQWTMIWRLMYKSFFLRLSKILYYLLTPWSRVFLQNLTSFKLVKKFSAFYETWMFITTYTSAHHLSLSWIRLIQSMPPQPTSSQSILLLSSHLRLGLPSGLLLSGFPTKTLSTPLLSPMCVTCHGHLILLNLIPGTIFDEEYYNTIILEQNTFLAKICRVLHVKMHKCGSHNDANCEFKFCVKTAASAPYINWRAHCHQVQSYSHVSFM